MVGGKVKQDLTIRAILNKISAYDIYRYYIGEDIPINRAFSSPMPNRRDNNPSFVINSKGGKLHHRDFADDTYSGDCVDFVQQQQMLVSYNDALRVINRDFGLGLGYGEDKGNIERRAPVFKAPLIEDRRESFIQVATKRFTEEELRWWGEYHITEQELKDNQIYSVDRLFVDRKRSSMKKGDLVFGYLYVDKWKIYKPLAPKEDKWLSSVSFFTPDQLDNVKVGCGKAIVTKSRKDLIIIKKIFPYVCGVQNESLQALSKETISHLRDSKAEVYINYDNDLAGKKSSIRITRQYGFKHINVPDDYTKHKIKDFSDMSKIMGMQAVEDYFKLKGLI